MVGVVISRRALLHGALGLGASGCFRLARPARAEKPLSPEARAMWRHAWRGLDAREVLDTHVHVVGTGEGGTGCWLNPAALATLSHPIAAARFSIYKIAAGVEHEAHADSEYRDTLTSRAQSPVTRALRRASPARSSTACPPSTDPPSTSSATAR